MDTVFTDRTSTNNAFDISLFSQHRDQLLATLRQAAARASLIGHASLASITLPIASYEPAQIFQAFQALHTGERFFWEEPAGRRVLVGVGSAVSIESGALAPIPDAIEGWHELQRGAVTAFFGNSEELEQGESAPGPVLMGGFSFDPLRPRTALWDGFPTGLLLLPSLLFQRNGEGATLTINTMVARESNIEQVAEAIASDLQAVSATLQEHLRRQETHPAVLAAQHIRLTTRDILPASEWMELVARAVHAIHQGDYKKVLLARAVQAQARQQALSIDAALFRLRRDHPEAFKFVVQRGDRCFIGATPERLLRVQAGQAQTMALAGTAPRGATLEEDRRLGMELLHSAKNRQEHEIVVTMLRGALADLCSELWVADVPELLQLHNLQHLKTPIIGELLPGRSILDAIAVLHPTPAVGGFPREAALREIREHEGLDRGWYAGPIGWLDLAGNGEFAVALRSALIDPSGATLFAGCGIVADSQPRSEYDESCLKLTVMLRALSGEER